MKQNFLKLLLFITVLSCLSCSKNEHWNKEMYSVNLLTEVNYNVTMSDVKKYISVKSPQLKSMGEFSIIPVAINNDTLVYIINSDSSCELLVGDKRLEPFLAVGDKPYHLDSLNDNEAFWLESELDYIYNFKHGAKTKAMDKIDDFWLYFDKPKINTRVEGDPIEDNKYWELEEIQDYNYEEETDGHLLKTNWTQKAPWNACVPLSSSGTEERSRAGCIAVACAQVLHYLNEYIGKPSAFFTQGYCSGNTDNYNFYFSSMSESAFGNMALRTDDYNKSTYQSALLIGWAGSTANLDYGSNATGGDFVDCKKVFDACNINYTCTNNFDRDKVLSSVIRGVPVILGGQKEKFDVGLFSVTYGGHVWVADGYIIKKYTKRYIYKWTSRTQNELYEYGERKEEFVESKDYYVLMNWGFGDDNNNVQYKLRGDWIVEDGAGKRYDYRYNRKMIYGFN